MNTIISSIARPIMRLSTRTSASIKPIKPINPIRRDIRRTQKTAILLDLDGVINHHPLAEKEVKVQVVKFVQAALQNYIGDVGNVDYQTATQVNDQLYSMYGHTLIGLEAEFDIKTSTRAFNDYVYSPAVLASIKNASPEHFRGAAVRAWDTRKLVERCLAVANDREVCPYIFTNSPTVWTDFILELLGLKELFPKENWITSDSHEMIYRNCFKPDPAMYSLAKTVIQTDNVIFIDDSLQNLVPMAYEWKTYLMDNNMVKSAHHVQIAGVEVIKCLSEVRV